MSVDIDIIARDPMDREQLEDLVLMQFHHYENERLAEDGLCITSVSGGGESEEVYDDNGDDYFFRSSVSVELLADWEVYYPRPLYIERIVNVSYEAEAASAGPDGTLPGFTDIRPVEDLRVSEQREKDRKAAFTDRERIR